MALIAGNLTLFGGIAAAVVSQDRPEVPLLDGLRDAAGGAATGNTLSVGPGLLTRTLFFFNDKAVPLLIVAVVAAIGAAAMAGVLGYLFRATKARNPTLPRIALFGALIGPGLVAVAGLAAAIGIAMEAQQFVDGNDYSTDTAHDAVGGGLIVAGQALGSAGSLLVAFSFILISLNAMRVGLLTRFMGFLGMIAGGLQVVPLEALFLGSSSRLPVIQCFWLIAVGFLIIDKWPDATGRPPAWTTGVAEPWPTKQEEREARAAALAESRGEDPPEPRGSRAPDPSSADDDAGGNVGGIGSAARRPDGVAHPTSKKRKNRKRR